MQITATMSTEKKEEKEEEKKIKRQNFKMFTKFAPFCVTSDIQNSSFVIFSVKNSESDSKPNAIKLSKIGRAGLALESRLLILYHTCQYVLFVQRPNPKIQIIDADRK